MMTISPEALVLPIAMAVAAGLVGCFAVMRRMTLAGASQRPGPLETGLGLAGAIIVATTVLRARHRLVIALVSADLARTVGIRMRRLDLMYLLGFALTARLGLRYLGVLLMGSLIIIPATTARHLARSLGGMLALATGFAVGSTVLGALAAPLIQVATGPLVIAIAAGGFMLGLLLRQRG